MRESATGNSKIVLKVYESYLSKLIRARISRWPHYQQIKDTGPLQRVRLILRVILTLISETLRENKTSRQNRRRTKKLRNSQKGEVLLLGGGPSVANLSIAQIERFKRNGGKIAVMNGFVFSELATSISLDYYFILDPGYWDSSELSTEFRRKLQELSLNPLSSFMLVHPSNQTNLVEKSMDVIHVGGRDLSGLMKIASPYSFWGLPASTALIAISTLKFLGFKRIYFAGLESNTYKNYFVNDLNEVLFAKDGNYFYTEPKLEQNESFQSDTGILSMEGSPIRHMADVLYSCAVFMRDMSWLMKEKCVNVGNDATNDAAPRACLLK